MRSENVALYDAPFLYDAVVPPGPCESFYVRLADRTGGRVLELACGTGRLSLPLAEAGHPVLALDNSAAMLGAASRKAKEAGLRIEFVQGDMRSFELDWDFSLVIVSCNSLSHLVTNEELLGTLRRISRHLAPGGLLAFDVMNPRLADLMPATRPNIHLDGAEDRLKTATSEELLAYDPVTQVRVLQWQITADDERRRTKEMHLRAIFPQELALLLNAAGFDLAARFGDFSGSPLDADSLNQVCIAYRSLDRRQ